MIALQVQLLTHAACYHLAIKQVLLTSPAPPVDVPLQRTRRTTSSASSTEVSLVHIVKNNLHISLQSSAELLAESLHRRAITWNVFPYNLPMLVNRPTL